MTSRKDSGAGSSPIRGHREKWRGDLAVAFCASVGRPATTIGASASLRGPATTVFRIASNQPASFCGISVRASRRDDATRMAERVRHWAGLVREQHEEPCGRREGERVACNILFKSPRRSLNAEPALPLPAARFEPGQAVQVVLLSFAGTIPRFEGSVR